MDTSGYAARVTWVGWFAGVACALVVTLATARLVRQRGYDGVALVAAATAFGLLVLPYFLLATTDLASRLAMWMAPRRGRAVVLVTIPILSYLVYAIGTETLSSVSLAKVVGYVLVPSLVLIEADRSGPPPRWQDALAVLAVWIPLELGWLKSAWPWPAGLGAYTFTEVLGVDMAVILFVSVRRLGGVGYSFAIRPVDLRVAGGNLLIFICIAIPIGLWTRFISVGHHDHDVVRFLARFIGILLGVAVPEELLFRGLIQNLLQRVLPPTHALLVAAVIFGASHLNNGPAPDWRYVLLASIAGVFYGRAYRSSGGLMAGCLVHAAVDTIWAEFFR